MSSNETSRKTLICRIWYGVFGIIIGFSVFLLWLLKFNTTQASLHTISFGGLSGVLAAWNVVNHLMHLQDYWRTWLKGLKWFMACGIVFMIISSAGFVTYLVFGITKHQEPTVDSFYITSIWCFITFKWAALLFIYSRSYRNEFADLTALLEF